jgi:predicted nuclease of predicted toxin-antitoxin system
MPAMKILFDQNLSHRLVPALADLYPQSQHVRNIGLKEATDTDIWEYAKNNGFTIVSKDTDFYQRSLLHGSPPKVIWIKLGNCATHQVEQTLRDHHEDVKLFATDATATFLIVS